MTGKGTILVEDGFEVFRRLKARSESRDIPVIFISAATGVEKRVAGLRLEAVDFINKPFQLEELLARVATHLELSRLRARLVQQADELRDALAEVKPLSGFIPICASCKKIRDDQGCWGQIEKYLTEHSDAQFSHGICPDCVRRLYPDLTEGDAPGDGCFFSYLPLPATINSDTSFSRFAASNGFSSLRLPTLAR